MAGQAAGGHTAAGLKNNGLASLLSVRRANNNQPPHAHTQVSKNILRVQTAGLEEVRGGRKTGFHVCVFQQI